MRGFKDNVSGEDLFTDANKIELVDDLYYLVTGKYVKRCDDDNYDTGANPSAEEEDEQTESAAKTGIDIVLDNNLCETSFGKFSEFQKQSKDCIKKMQERVQKQHECEGKEFDVKCYQQRIINFFNTVLKTRFKELQFFQVPSFTDGSLIIPCYHTDDNIPILVFLKDGLKEEKY